jgi:hypothetical protein
MDKTGNIADAIRDLRNDIKAEVLMADFMEKGLQPEEFIVFPSGSFARRFSSDIKKAETLRLGNHQKLLTIHVNRDGIYDSLPEGFFHAESERPPRGSSEMSEESKRLRKEEKESRAFFLPFENEIFLQRIVLEISERRILNHFSETLFDEIYPEFWNLDKSLDARYLSKLGVLLPHAHQMAGNPLLTARSLEFIIGEKVTVRMFRSGEKKGEKFIRSVQENLPLGASRLGMDFICGECFDDLLPAMEFIIGPVKKENIPDYVEQGRTRKFLDCFFQYLIPADTIVTTTITVNHDEQDFILENGSWASTLGFDTSL